MEQLVNVVVSGIPIEHPSIQSFSLVAVLGRTGTWLVAVGRSTPAASLSARHSVLLPSLSWMVMPWLILAMSQAKHRHGLAAQTHSCRLISNEY